VRVRAQADRVHLRAALVVDPGLYGVRREDNALQQELVVVLVLPRGFVDVATLVPGIVADLRYATANNFVGARIDGYRAARCILTRQAAEALAAVQQDLAERGLGLKLFDCYRPCNTRAAFLVDRDGVVRHAQVNEPTVLPDAQAALAAARTVLA